VKDEGSRQDIEEKKKQVRKEYKEGTSEGL
jgi:hypothetical protein